MILFAAITLPSETIAALQALQHGVNIARWRPGDTFHLTVRYYGSGDGDQADTLRRRLGEVKARTFALEIAGVGVLPTGPKQSGGYARRVAPRA